MRKDQTRDEKKPKNYYLQGPVQINTAYSDVEYILCSLLGQPYPDNSVEYAPKEGVSNNASISFNSQDHVLVSCPNGVEYNLTCALRNANLNYFSFSRKRHKKVLQALESILIPHRTNPDESLVLAETKLPDDIDIEIFHIEERAICNYAANDYFNINKLLQGAKFEDFFNFHDVQLKKEITKIFFNALLTISAVNKFTFPTPKKTKLSADGTPENNNEIIELHRVIKFLPSGMTSSMLRPGGSLFLSGLNSFSDSHGHYGASSELLLRIHGPKTESIEIFKSQYNHEREHLLPPGKYWFPNNKVIEKSSENHFIIDAAPLHGLAAEEQEFYFTELALSVAQEKYLSKNYTDGSSRENHSLSHHARTVSYIQPVIEYFSKYSDDPDLKNYCTQLSHNDIEIIKVIMAFSKTGRESEISFHDNPQTYLEYQQKSRKNTEDFLKHYLLLDRKIEHQENERKKNEITFSDQIENQRYNRDSSFYGEIQYFLGDPEYPNKATGSEAEKQEKIFIHHITTFAHKLDLIRCYNEREYESAISTYEPRQNEQSDDIVKERNEEFTKLKLLANKSIEVTLFESAFNRKKCNSNVFYCLDLLTFVNNQVMNPNKENQNLLEHPKFFYQCSKKLETNIQSKDDLDNLYNKLRNELFSFTIGTYYDEYGKLNQKYHPTDIRQNNPLEKRKVYIDNTIHIHTDYDADPNDPLGSEKSLYVKCFYLKENGEIHRFNAYIDILEDQNLLQNFFDEDVEALEVCPYKFTDNHLSNLIRKNILMHVNSNNDMPHGQSLMFDKYLTCQRAISFLTNNLSCFFGSFEQFFSLIIDSIFTPSHTNKILLQAESFLPNLITHTKQLEEILKLHILTDESIELIFSKLKKSGALTEILRNENSRLTGKYNKYERECYLTPRCIIDILDSLDYSSIRQKDINLFINNILEQINNGQYHCISERSSYYELCYFNKTPWEKETKLKLIEHLLEKIKTQVSEKISDQYINIINDQRDGYLPRNNEDNAPDKLRPKI